MEEEKTIKISIGKSSGNVKVEYDGFADAVEVYSALYGVANKIQVGAHCNAPLQENNG